MRPSNSKIEAVHLSPSSGASRLLGLYFLVIYGHIPASLILLVIQPFHTSFIYIWKSARNMYLLDFQKIVIFLYKDVKEREE